MKHRLMCILMLPALLLGLGGCGGAGDQESIIITDADQDWPPGELASGSFLRISGEYQRGVNAALQCIMLHDLELSLDCTIMTWGERADIVRMRLGVKKADVKLSWIKTWTAGEDRHGVPKGLASGSPHHTTECGSGNFITALGISQVIEADGQRFHRAGINREIPKNPCADGANPVFRDYPTFGFHDNSSKFDLPVLIRLKIRIKAENGYAFANDRFSQMTAKGRDGAAGEIMTMHILPDGTMDIGHSLQTWPPGQSTSIEKIPLDRWYIQSLFIYHKTGQTLAIAWIDTVKAIEAACKVNWADRQLRNIHAGSYYQNITQYPVEQFFIDNDDYQVNEVSDRNEAFELIKESVANLNNGDTVPIPTPVDTVKVKITWDTNPENDISHYWVLFEGINVYKVNHPDTTIVLDLLTNQTYHIAVQAEDKAGNISEPSNELVYTVPVIDSPPSKPKGLKVDLLGNE